MDALMSKAKMAGADFRAANLYRADLLRARGDDKTRFTGANVALVRGAGSDAGGRGRFL
jgi:uncharacterized protein YjbI with pentapeptide repeats